MKCNICKETKYGSGGTYRHGLYFCWKDECTKKGWGKIRKLNKEIERKLKKKRLCVWPNEGASGYCEAPTTKGNYCKKHIRKCEACGKPATHGCPNPKQFICGTPLCDKCKCPNC